MTDTTSEFDRSGVGNVMAVRNLRVLSATALTRSITRVRRVGPEASGMLPDGQSDHIDEVLAILTAAHADTDRYPFPQPAQRRCRPRPSRTDRSRRPGRRVVMMDSASAESARFTTSAGVR